MNVILNFDSYLPELESVQGYFMSFDGPVQFFLTCMCFSHFLFES